MVSSPVHCIKIIQYNRHVESALKTNLLKGSYIVVAPWQIKLFKSIDEVHIFLKNIYFFAAGRKLFVVDIKYAYV